MIVSVGDVWKTWSNVDGVELAFRSYNRPARRYLYFRHLFTYFHAKQVENGGWADKLESKGHHMWANPGPYLRRSMLEILTRKATDVVLPEVFWKMVADTTFGESESSPAVSAMEEEVLGTSLAIRCSQYANSRRVDEDEDEYDDD